MTHKRDPIRSTIDRLTEAEAKAALVGAVAMSAHPLAGDGFSRAALHVLQTKDEGGTSGYKKALGEMQLFCRVWSNCADALGNAKGAGPN